MTTLSRLFQPFMQLLDGIAAAAILSLLNYLILGFQFQIDGFFLHSFEVWLACTVVFPGLGNLGFTLLEYRLGQRSVLSSLAENMKWVPFLCVLSMTPLSSLLIPVDYSSPLQLFLLWWSQHPPVYSGPRTPVLVRHFMGSYQEGSRAFQFLPRSAQDMASLSTGTRAVHPNGRCDDRAEYKHEYRPYWMAN
jgi:hypothetical protein